MRGLGQGDLQNQQPEGRGGEIWHGVDSFRSQGQDWSRSHQMVVIHSTLFPYLSYHYCEKEEARGSSSSESDDTPLS